MSKLTEFKKFNTTYFDFLKFIQKYLNNDPNFKLFYRKNQIVRETNIKLFIKTWNMRINDKYYSQIINKDFDFFLNKSYEEDLVKSEQETPLLKYIGDFKKVFPTLEENVKNDFLNFIIELTKSCNIYYTN